MTPEVDYKFHDPLPRQPELDDGAIRRLAADETIDEDEDLDDEELDEDDEDEESSTVPPSDLSQEKQLDHGLKETFPASDPVSINPGAD
ncbi:hypothetical protein ABOZ73_16505 [Caulobacter sp. 73W]|uniref:Uncharacterized protein n=1 Tax=Caulobacter sp. 73W TaxID=3161137 RepID=A0AB39KS29_9CAUL